MRLFIGLAVLAMVVAPASANLLSDSEGGFEDPWPSSPNAWQGPIERDSSIHGPGGPAEGSHYGTVQGAHGTNADKYAYLTSIMVPPSEQITLTGLVAGGTVNTPNGAELYIQLLDGSNDGSPVMGEWRVTLPNGYGTGWIPFDPIVAHPTDGHVTIKFGTKILSGWSDGTAIHLDALNLTPEPASLGLFALAGLPLLRRRR